MGRKEKKDPNNFQETKKAAKSASRARLTDFLAFFGLAVAAILIVLGPILRWLSKENVYSVLNMIAQYSLLAAIAIPAWIFVSRKRMGWKIFYLVVLLVYLVGTVLGVAL